jgi:hypothetical protein
LFTKGGFSDLYRATLIVSRRSSIALETAKLRGGLFAVLLALVAVGAALLPSASVAGGTPCGNAAAAPARLTLHQMRSSELCLINRARAHYGLVPLQYNPDLRDSATGHSDSMVVHRYFAHEGPGGSVDSRISRTGYLDKGVQDFTIGENIAAGSGHDGSPWQIFVDWMHSRRTGPTSSIRDSATPGSASPVASRSAGPAPRRPTRSISAPGSSDCKLSYLLSHTPVQKIG